MLFARVYVPWNELLPEREGVAVEHQIEEDVRRGYSFWDGEYNPALPEDPGISRRGSVRERMLRLAETMPESAAELGQKELPAMSRGGILPGLCALCAAESYRELARKIWDEYNENEARRKRGCSLLGNRLNEGYIAVFEGEPVGHDEEGWPLFTAKKLLAIAPINAIVRDV
jgi:hypothetical protein